MRNSIPMKCRDGSEPEGGAEDVFHKAIYSSPYRSCRGCNVFNDTHRASMEEKLNTSHAASIIRGFNGFFSLSTSPF